ncbi:MAG: phosphate ABC transporter substrate-binding protein PstS [Acidobacteriota bacterium]
MQLRKQEEKMQLRKMVLGVGVAAALFLLPAAAAAQDLTGAGATFPFPIYSKWFDVYAGKTGVRINYQSIGSGGGIRQITEGTVDFGATDGPMNDEELAGVSGDLIHIPTVLGAVAVVYHLPGLAAPLRLDADALSGIFLNTLKKWDDPRIAALNPGVSLPALPILVIHRSDGSGTTYVLSDYLSSVSPAWSQRIGKGKSLSWPTGLGAKGNEGVSGQVKQMPGAMGYVELAYARQNHLSMAEIRNRSGRFVRPTIAGTTAAAAGAAANLDEGTDFRVSIVNAEGAEAYPIASFTWLLLYREQDDPRKGKQLVDFIWWAVHEGEKYAQALDYAPIPDEMVRLIEKKLETVSSGGQGLLAAGR